MKHFASAILLAIAISRTICTDGVQQWDRHANPDGTYEPPSVYMTVQTKNFPCPEMTAIAPCICTADTSNHLIMDCSNVTSNEELNNAFQGHFPVTDFYEFVIQNNDYFSQLQSGCFKNVTFERIFIYNTSINLVSQYALTTTGSRLTWVHIHGGFLTDSTFPFDYLSQYTNIGTLAVDYQTHLTWVPPLTSNIVNYFALNYCSITSISPGKQFNL